MQYDIPEKLRAVTGDSIRPGGLILTERAVDFCGFSKSARIVDIGCGFGTTLSHLRHRHGFRVCGIDISARMLSGSPVQTAVQAGAENLPFGADVFEGIFCECVLSLLSPPERALDEFHRVLRSGGYLVMSDLYLRNPGKRFYPVSSCLSGAVTKSERIMQLSDCGFELLLWEDHSGYLKEMAARIVWRMGSREDLMKLFFPGHCSACDWASIQRARPGYFLLIARKK
ncbi:MAG: class I SAM-dependent methyltransferase [Desulfobacteraceae bacterium]|nr:MAG: class I SAM-dependent methyltransferase [Desulfobacteraceae bacterium]